MRQRLETNHPDSAQRDVVTQARLHEVEEACESLDTLIASLSVDGVAAELNFCLGFHFVGSEWE